MDRFYITSSYLKAAHYFFFSMSVFSLTAATAFFGTYGQSLILVIFCVIYANVSVWLAYFFYRDYENEIKDIMVLRTYTLPYIALSLFVFLGTEALVMTASSISSIIFSILFLNYYYIFVIIIGAAMYTLKPVRKLFEFHNRRAIMNAMKIAMEFSRLQELRHYKPGSDPEIDSILDNIWSSRKYPAPHVQRLEIEMCRSRLNRIEAKLHFAKNNKDAVAVKSLEKEKAKYERMLEQIKSYRD